MGIVLLPPRVFAVAVDLDLPHHRINLDLPIRTKPVHISTRKGKCGADVLGGGGLVLMFWVFRTESKKFRTDQDKEIWQKSRSDGYFPLSIWR